MRSRHRLTTARHEHNRGDIFSPSTPTDADLDKLTAQLKVQLYRIYASLSRQREWFVLHEANARALAEEAEALRERFFPQEPSLLPALNDSFIITTLGHTSSSSSGSEKGHDRVRGEVSTISPTHLQTIMPTAASSMMMPCCFSSHPSYAEGSTRFDFTQLCHSIYQPHHCAADTQCSTLSVVSPLDSLAAIQSVVPAYLLQLTPGWIHSQLDNRERSFSEYTEAALIALLLPLLQALHNIIHMALPCVAANDANGVRSVDATIHFGPFYAVSRHLFYLLHETLSCLSSVPATQSLNSVTRAEAKQILLQLLDAEGSGMWLRHLLCSDSTDNVMLPHNMRIAAAVRQSVVGEAFDFLAIHYLQMNGGE